MWLWTTKTLQLVLFIDCRNAWVKHSTATSRVLANAIELTSTRNHSCRNQFSWVCHAIVLNGGNWLGEKSFWKNFISSRDGTEKSTETRPGWESLKNPTPLRNDAGPLSGLQRNALASLVHFVTHTTKRTRDASALRWRPERWPSLFRSGVGFLRLSHPGLVSVLFSAPSLIEMKFFQKLFPLVSVLFGGFLNQHSKYNSFHLRIRYRTADECVDR